MDCFIISIGIIASNGKIAIEKLQAKSCEFVLMELQMPVMNGLEGCATLVLMSVAAIVLVYMQYC